MELTKLLWQRLPNHVFLLAQLLASFLVQGKSPRVFSGIVEFKSLVVVTLRRQLPTGALIIS